MHVTRILAVAVSVALLGAIAYARRLFGKRGPLDAGVVSGTWLADQERGR